MVEVLVIVYSVNVITTIGKTWLQIIVWLFYLFPKMFAVPIKICHIIGSILRLLPGLDKVKTNVLKNSTFVVIKTETNCS